MSRASVVVVVAAAIGVIVVVEPGGGENEAHVLLLRGVWEIKYDRRTIFPTQYPQYKLNIAVYEQDEA